MHKKRRHVYVTRTVLDELAVELTEWTWCGCNAFRIEVDGVELTFLNDSTGGDGAQEYAVFVRLPEGPLAEVESFTCGSWIKAPRFVELTREVVANVKAGIHTVYSTWQPVLETPEQHISCGCCA